MKTGILWGIILICLSVFVFGFGGSLLSNANDARADSSEQEIGFFSKAIEAAYYQEGGNILSITWFKIYNISRWNNITLGNIYIKHPDGMGGVDTTVWKVPYNLIITPCSSYSFGIEETGVVPRDPSSPRGSWLVIITWFGEEEDLQMCGSVNTKDSAGYLVSCRTVYPFELF